MSGRQPMAAVLALLAAVLPAVALEASAMPQPPQQAGETAAASPSPQAPAGAAGQRPVLALSLDDAIQRALVNNELISIQRDEVSAAQSAITGAEGAYDAVLAAQFGWRRVNEPVNSAFAGTADGQAALTNESADTSVELRKLLGTGAEVSVRTGASHGSSDGAFDLLSPSYGSNLGVAFRQPLLRDRGVDAARLGLTVTAADRTRAGASLRAEIIDTVARVERAYWTLVALRQAIEVREQAIELAAEQLEQTRLRIESGVTPETQISEPVAELERRRGELLETQEAAARAENILKLLILGDADGDLWAAGIDPTEGAVVTLAPVDIAAALADALASRVEIDAARAVAERRHAETLYARDGTKPVLDLVVAYDRFGLAGSPNGTPIPGLPAPAAPGLDGNWWDSYETLFGGDFDDARIGLVFELPIGNRTARARAAIATSNERSARSEVARIRKVVRAEVLDAAALLQTAEARIQAARAAREAAEVQLSVEQERFAVGLSTNFLVLTRQNDLAGARLDEIAALTDYRTARTEMARATGSLLAERGIQLQEG